jgi:tRNA G18 (ribose-2'-O)-methylase SpoU
MEAVAGFPIHRGCLAAGERGTEESAETLADRARTVVVLEAIANHDNIGGIFRNVLAFGGDAVLLDDRCADPLYRKAIRVSVGASLTMPFARIDAWADGLARLSAAGYTLVALTPDAAAIDIAGLPAERLGAGRVALFVGAEGAGLGPETRAMADARVRIPMAPGVDSLNVATAAGIALHRLGRALT